jgi:hypothetical protein
MLNKIFVFALIAFANSCATQKNTSATDITLLYNCWTDSREETKEGDTTFIYRPCDFKDFTPSRFRHRMELKQNGEGSSLILAPTDAHYTVPTKWAYDKDQKIVTVKDESGKVILKFKVVALAKDRLEIDKIRVH